MWHVDNEQTGFLELPNFDARVEIARPQSGLLDVHCQGSPIHARLLQVGLAEHHVQDCYVRLQDLVITFEPRPPYQLRPQIYWRSVIESRPWLRGVELILSMQTDLLDSQPQTIIYSTLEADRAFYLSHGETLLEVDAPEAGLNSETSQPVILLTGPFGSYLEMAMPGDFVQLGIRRTGPALETSWTLFPDNLEKGVIRRGRIRAVFSAAGLSASDVGAIFEEFLASPLPLTT